MNVLTKVFKAVANENRLRILKVLMDGRAREIGEISNEVNLPYKTTARNLKIFEKYDFLKSNVNSGIVYYQIRKDRKLFYNQMILTMIKRSTA